MADANCKMELNTISWNVIHECDDGNGNPTSWAGHMRNGKIIWIDKISDHEYGITDNGNRTDDYMKICRSLTSSKRWVTTNLL